MPRKPNASTSWLILRDRHTGHLSVRNPEEGIDGRRLRADVNAINDRYQKVGIMQQRDDADFFVLSAELGLTADAIAYLKLEHDMGMALLSGSKVAAEDLDMRIHAIRKETGRACFGQCDSLNHTATCALCYAEQRETWKICAQTSCCLRGACARS